MRPARPGPLHHLARRYALPAVVALVLHGALLLGSNPRPISHGLPGTGSRSGASALQMTLVEHPSPPLAPTAELLDPPSAEPEAIPAPSDPLAFAPTPEPMPRPDLPAPPDLRPGEASLDASAIADALRRTLTGHGRRADSARQAAGGFPGRPGRPADNAGDGELFDLAQLDCEPALLRVPEFQFPAHLSRQGLHAGRVTVVVRVNASGRVHLLSVTDSSHPDLVPAVREAVARALFQPPLRQGRRVALRYSWTLELKDRTQIADRRNS